MKALIIYHVADADGCLSGFLGARAFDTKHNIEYVPWDYHYDPIPLVERIETEDIEIVFMSDVSLSTEYMKRIKDKMGKNFIWIDHHISAIKDCQAAGLEIEGIRQVGVAACRLTANFFGFAVRSGLEMAALYDVWDKSSLVYNWDGEIIPYQYFLRSIDLQPNSVEGNGNCEMVCASTYTAEHIKIGKKIVYFCKQEYKRLSFFDVLFEGIVFRAVNRIGGSTVFEFVNETGEALMSFSTVRPNLVKFSLYGGSNDDLDLSVIAKKYGGGGHARACGFAVDGKTASEILNGKF